MGAFVVAGNRGSAVRIIGGKMLNILKSSTFLTGLRAGAGLALVAALLPLPAMATTAVTITPENVAVFNLLSPFLNLNATLTGQQTLAASLSQADAINQNAASVSVLNGGLSTATLAALAISDENLLGKASNTVTGLSGTYGPAANLAGGLPTQNTSGWAVYNGAQPIGGFGSILGAAYVTDVSPSNTTLPNTVALLTAALNQTGNTGPASMPGDSQVAKFYFANGTSNGTTTAVAPNGYTLPTDNGYPNTTTSVYDTQYGVSNTTAGQNAYGDSHPYQTVPQGVSYTLWDSTVKTASTVAGAPSPSSNPSFPSSHMAYAMTDSLLLGMMVPQLYQSMLLRASEMGESRIVVGVHYPLDIIGSRAFSSYDLANLLNNPAYINNASVTGTAINLPSLFASAAPELQGQLTQAAAAASCGTSLATCATSATNVNPYAASAANAATYAARLTYGLPTLSFAQAPAEQAPTSGPNAGPDASILLATLYGGSSATAQNLANAVSGVVGSGGSLGNLSTNTINQIILNTETNALSAFYGTSLSYWARINLYAAAGYFQDVTGTLSLANTDKVNTSVTVASGGVMNGGGTITGAVAVQAGGMLGGTSAAPAITTVNGAVTQAAGSTFSVNIDGQTAGNGAGNYSQLNVSNGYVLAAASGATAAPTLQFNLRNVTGANNSFVPTIGQSYTLVQAAGGVSGAFGSVVEPTSGLASNTTLTIGYSPTAITAYVTPTSYGSAAATGLSLTGNEASVGAVLDRLRANTGNGVTADSNTSLLLSTLGGVSASKLQAGLTQLSGVGVLNTASGGAAVGHATDQALNSRLAQLHSGETDVAEKAADGMFSLTMGSNGGGSSGIAAGDQASDNHSWGRALGVFSNNYGDGSAPGFRSQIGGGIVGSDVRVTDELVLGGSLGYAQSWVAGSDGSGKTNGNSYQVTGYGSYDVDQMFVDGSLGYTFSTYNSSRDIAIGAFAATANGKTNGGDFAAAAKIGRRYGVEGIDFEPDLGLSYDRIVTQGFTESGAGIFDLAVGKSTVNSLRGSLGGRAFTTVAVDTAKVMPELRLHWEHEFADQSTLATSSLAGVPFTVNSAKPGRDAAVIGVGLSALADDNLRIFTNYDASLRENQTDQTITAGVKITW
jgi:uncharacterized protein with beta-barrel porin domain